MDGHKVAARGKRDDDESDASKSKKRRHFGRHEGNYRRALPPWSALFVSGIESSRKISPGTLLKA